MSSKVKEAKARISKYLSYSATDQAIDKEDSKKTFKIYLECLKPSYKYILIYFVIILFDVFLSFACLRRLNPLLPCRHFRTYRLSEVRP